MNSKFRHWLHELWLQNCDEHDEDRQPRYTQAEYFQQFKYWLKREFRHQQLKESAVVVDSNLVLSVAIDDKLEYTSATLLSQSQNRLLQTLKDKNEKQR
jgi:hypothetical protein